MPDWTRGKKHKGEGEGKKTVARQSLPLPINDLTIYLSRHTPATAGRRQDVSTL